MTSGLDMSAPVTRGELRDELGRLKAELDADRGAEPRPNLARELAPLATKAELREAIAPLATKAELREAIASAIAPLATKVELREAIASAIAPLATKVELREAIANAVAPLATKVELELWGGALMARMDTQLDGVRRDMQAMRLDLQADFARHANVIFESAQAMIRALDDKYADLPRRVTDIEARLLDVERR
jgi:hypothetical protein